MEGIRKDGEGAFSWDGGRGPCRPPAMLQVSDGGHRCAPRLLLVSAGGALGSERPRVWGWRRAGPGLRTAPHASGPPGLALGDVMPFELTRVPKGLRESYTHVHHVKCRFRC